MRIPTRLASAAGRRRPREVAAESHDVPDLIEPIVGWRVWRVSAGADGWQLESVVYGASWPVGRPHVARCQRAWSILTLPRPAARHDAPALGCECGIHAATGTGALSPFMWDPPRHVGRPWLPRAVGRVRLWGTVVAGPLGWRGSHAYPDDVWLVVDDRVPTSSVDEVLLGISRYGVPVHAVESGSTDMLAGLEAVSP